MTPVLVEVVAPMLSSVSLSCRGCGLMLNRLGIEQEYRNACSNEYPEQWQESALRLSDWIREISRLYKHRVLIRVIDAQSPLGLWKQIRHRLGKMPAFIVDRKQTYTGWDTVQLESLIDQRLQEISLPQIHL